MGVPKEPTMEQDRETLRAQQRAYQEKLLQQAAQSRRSDKLPAQQQQADRFGSPGHLYRLRQQQQSQKQD